MSRKELKTNVKYLKENNLYDAHKHFMRLSEAYIQLPEELEEAGDDEQDPNAGGEPMGGDPNGGGMPGGDMGGDPNAAGGADPMGGDPNGGDMPGGDMGADPNAGADPMGGDPNADPMGGGMPGGDPMGGMDAGAPMGDPMGGDMGAADDEEVIDVDALTKAQEKLNIKQNHVGSDLGKVDTKIADLLKSIESMQASIASTNDEIQSLKDEFQKRNPTATEKLNLRSLDSYPFNISPVDYWKHQAENGKYNPYSDNDQSTTQEYEITNSDVDNPTRDIADTFFKVDDDDIQNINKIFGL